MEGVGGGIAASTNYRSRCVLSDKRGLHRDLACRGTIYTVSMETEAGEQDGGRRSIGWLFERRFRRSRLGMSGGNKMADGGMLTDRNITDG
ncbi:hypothetical protein CDAR_580331 [Caerostris darwini]|uniref:Uncharacterized protein n=1 Tax=Caerostris darwini TaxID=1538125 RepID=A0AAV4RF95_9ARAC|nr:hypothetical protein CDAR_580331 [Caerostris darwini]